MRDVLELDPSQRPRRAQHRPDPDRAGQSARPRSARLDDLAGRAPAADVGLAYALAGAADRAVQIARSGRPRRRRRRRAPARISRSLMRSPAIGAAPARVAAQDVSPAELAARMAAMGGVSPGPAPARPRSPPCSASARPQDPASRSALALAPKPRPPAARPSPRRRPAPCAGPSTSPAPVRARPVQVAEARPAEAPAFWVPTAQSYQAAGRSAGRERRVAAEPARAAPEVRVQYASAAAQPGRARARA